MGQYRPPVMITRPNFLAKKVDKLEGVSADALIARTMAMVKKEASGFIDWVSKDLNAIKAMAGELAGGATPQSPLIAKIFRAAADIRDQGTVCGYPLVTRIAGLLCNFVDRAEQLDEREIALIVAHVDAMLTVTAARIKNERSKIAQNLVSDLENAAGKLRETP